MMHSCNSVGAPRLNKFIAVHVKSIGTRGHYFHTAEQQHYLEQC